MHRDLSSPSAVQPQSCHWFLPAAVPDAQGLRVEPMPETQEDDSFSPSTSHSVQCTRGCEEPPANHGEEERGECEERRLHPRWRDRQRQASQGHDDSGERAVLESAQTDGAAHGVAWAGCCHETASGSELYETHGQQWESSSHQRPPQHYHFYTPYAPLYFIYNYHLQLHNYYCHYYYNYFKKYFEDYYSYRYYFGATATTITTASAD